MNTSCIPYFKGDNCLQLPTNNCFVDYQLPCPSLKETLLFYGCWTPACMPCLLPGRICWQTFGCCHTEIKVAHQTCSLTQSQNIDIGPTSPKADPMAPVAWQGAHQGISVKVTAMTGSGKAGINTLVPSCGGTWFSTGPPGPCRQHSLGEWLLDHT